MSNTTAEEHGDKDRRTSEAGESQEKTKEVDDEWEKVSIPSVAAEKELKAAPIPTVNVWAQRTQARQAAQKQAAPSTTQSKPRMQVPRSDDSR